MRRPQLIFIAAAVCGGAWWFFQHYRIAGLDHLEFKPRGAAAPRAPAPADEFAAPVLERAHGTIRIASFEMQAFGASKLAKPRVAALLAEVIRRFDIVAVQGISSSNAEALPRFVELVNATGRHYDFAAGPDVGCADPKDVLAILFDGASLEIDRTMLYTVEDPDDLLCCEPYVAWFRVRGPAASEAFTFTLANVRVAQRKAASELDALAGVFRAVRDDGRGEDDLILLGDFQADDHHLGRLGELSQMVSVISGLPTTTRGDRQTDNIVFSVAKSATVEYTGRSGVFDLVREFNLTTDEALGISDHLPVWAEFSIYEGGQGGRIAGRSDPAAQ